MFFLNRSGSNLLGALFIDQINVLKLLGGVSLARVANALDCDIVENEFELHSRYYASFRTYNLGKGMSPFFLAAMGSAV